MTDVLDRLIADVRRLDASARVGALDEENARKLAYSEFGSAMDPPQEREGAVLRPTLSVTTDALEPAINRAIDRRLKAAIDGKGTADGEAILREVGEDLREEVVAMIDSNVGPPLAESTKAKRRARGNQSDRTLVDTEQMRNSIKVETKRGASDWADGE